MLSLLRNLTVAAHWLMISLVCVMLAACGGGVSGDSSAGDGFFADTTPAVGGGGIGGKAAADANKIFAANAAPTPGSSDYKIAPLDVLEITVLGLPDLTRTAQVSTSGQISLPLINNVKAAGLSSAQLEKSIASKLSATYLQSPQVTVFIKEYNSQKITVDGAVNKPGIYPITGKMSLLQAIALAEGLNLVADTSGVLVFRSSGGKRQAARFDLKQVRGGRIPDPQLQAGDIVMVDESATRTTLRDVKDVLPLTGLFQLLAL
jgi:polysaccharide biosynthesis/export protein